MMKYFRDALGFFDENALWAYEGVVVPGGQLIFGRWWSPEEGGYNSPDVGLSACTGTVALCPGT